MFLTSHNEASDRHAVLEDDGTSCWLYLTAAGQRTPERDCFVYSPIEPAEELNTEAIREGAPPVLVRSAASKESVIRDAVEADFSFTWSSDGESVAVQRRGVPIAMIARGENRGHSRALAVSGPHGEPWNRALFEQTFGMPDD
ncbi:MAG: hypothetical protein AAF726_11055 [Planctomycetota bacterium]